MTFFYDTPGSCGIPSGVTRVVRRRKPGCYEVGAIFPGDPEPRWHWCSIPAKSKASALKKADAIYVILRNNAATRMQERAARLAQDIRDLLEIGT